MCIRDSAELQLGNSAVRYMHADWAREQQAEPACHAAMRYIVHARPPSLPADFFSCFPSHQRPSFWETQELAGEGRLHTTDDGIVLLVRQPTPQPPPDSQHPAGHAACLLNDEPVRTCSCSCAPGSCRLAIRKLAATSAPRALCECSNVFTGGLG